MTSLTLSKTPAYRYAKDVTCGKITVGIKVMAAVIRFLHDLDESKKKSYRWKFDVEKAYRPIVFMETFLVPTKGDYSKMELLPWQHFVEANLFGWVDKKTGLRRFREGLIIVGAGNGKSTMVGGNAIYCASKDGERGAEVYLLANSKDQAGIIYNECKSQIDSSPKLKKHFRALRDGIYYDATSSKIERLATDSEKQEGRNVHVAIFDELQDYETYKLLNVIKAKMKKRKQPLAIYITTLGSKLDGPLMDYYCLGSDILSDNGSIKKSVSDRMFVYIAEIDENDDPDDTSCWIKANPSIGKLLSLDTLVDEWERCKCVPQERANFINKQLNVFTNLDELSLFSAETIAKNHKNKIDIDVLLGRTCYGGYDLSNTQDFTAAGLWFPLNDGRYYFLHHTWVPRHKVKQDAEKLDWQSLQNEGCLTVCDSEYVKFELVYEWFCTMSKKYDIVCIGYDPAKAYGLVQALQTKGFDLDVVRQGEITLSAPLDHLKELYLDGKVVTNSDPLFRWYLTNVKTTKRGHNSTYLPTKQNKRRKIDGFAANLDAHVVCLRRNPLDNNTQEVATVIKLTR